MRDLELLRHYTTSVCFTLSGRPTIQQTMSIVVPSEAISHSCLMHGLLALSALHLSQSGIKNQRHYRAVAARHQSLAIPSLRTLLDNTNEHNCDAAFVAASFLMICAFAFPQQTSGSNLDAINEIFTVCELMKGITLITEIARHWIIKGRFSLLLRLGSLDIPELLPEDVEMALKKLELRNEIVEQTTVAKEACTSAISALRLTWTTVSSNRTDHGFGILWLGMVDRSYTNLLKTRHQMALTILAHYGVILHGLSVLWWTKGWGSRLVEAVRSRLDTNWLPLIQWPMGKVGLQQERTPAVCDGEIEELVPCGVLPASSQTSRTDDILQLPTTMIN